MNFIKLLDQKLGQDHHLEFWFKFWIQNNLYKINIFNKFWVSELVNIAHISILGPNSPESIILGQDDQFQVPHT